MIVQIKTKLKNLYLDLLNTGERPILEKRFEEIIPEFQFAYNLAAKKYVKNGSVLDMGCGGGYGTEYLSRFTKKKVIGYDIDKKTISIANKFFKKNNLTFTASMHDIARKHYDLVVMYQVIEHFTNTYMHEVLTQISKDLLDNNGIFLCSTPNKLVTSPGLKKPVMVFHNFEFTPTTLKNVLEKHFKKVTIYGQLEVSGSLLMKKSQMRRVHLTRKLSQIELVRIIARHLPIKLKYLFMGNLIKDTRTYVLAKTEQDIKKSFTLIAVCKN